MKKTLRKNMLTLRSSLTPDEITFKSQQISARVLGSEVYQRASFVMLYMDFKNEVETAGLILSALEDGKRVALPVVDQVAHRLVLVEITDMERDLNRSDFGILEPSITPENTLEPGAIDLILAPGVAFDLRGYRMGYGGGFYDQLLSQCDRDQVRVYALCFDIQVVSQVPIDPHDQRMDGLFTESGVHHFNGS